MYNNIRDIRAEIELEILGQPAKGSVFMAHFQKALADGSQFELWTDQGALLIGGYEVDNYRVLTILEVDSGFR